MAEIIINDVKYTNVPNKKAGTKFASALTQSNIGMSQAVQDYVNSSYFYALINAIDINWDGIDIGENTYINTTSDLIKWIESKAGDIDLSSYATVAYVNQKFEDLIGGAPETLDTLKELADALQEDASLAYVTQALEGKANVNDVYTKTEVDNLIPAPVDLSGYVSYTQANSYYVAKEDMPDLNDYATTSYVTTELDKKADKSQLPNLRDYALKAETFRTKNYTNGDIITSYWNPNSLVQKYNGIKSRHLVFPLYADKNWLGGGCGGADSIFALAASQSKYLSLIYSFVFGQNNEAHHNSGNTTPLYSNILIGEELKSNTHNTTVFGIYNNVGTYDESTTSSFNPDDSKHSLFVIGNGKDNYNRHNAFEIKRGGQIWIADTYNGTPYSLQSRLNSKANANDVYTKTEIDNLIPESADLSNYVSYTQANSYYMTVEGPKQVINSPKTFVGNKRINFRQSTSNDKLGFTLYNTDEKDVGGLEYRPNTINGNPLISLQHWVDNGSIAQSYLGFRQTRGSNKYHLLAPIPSNVSRIEDISSSSDYKNFFMPLVFKNGSNKVYTDCTGLVDMASLMPDLNDYATTSYVTTELDKKADLSDIPSAPDLTPYVTYVDANSYYVAKGDIPDVSDCLSYSDANSYYLKLNDISPIQTIKGQVNVAGTLAFPFPDSTTAVVTLSTHYEDLGGQYKNSALRIAQNIPDGPPLYIQTQLSNGDWQKIVFPSGDDIATWLGYPHLGYKPKDMSFFPLAFTTNNTTYIIPDKRGIVNLSSLIPSAPDMSNYVSYTQANSYYVAKEDMPDLNDYATVSYVTSELDKKADLSDIPSAPDLTPYVTYTDANSYYVDINSYNALAARVEELASWIVSYHTPTPDPGPGPTPVKQDVSLWHTSDGSSTATYISNNGSERRYVNISDSTTHTINFDSNVNDIVMSVDGISTGITVNNTTWPYSIEYTPSMMTEGDNYSFGFSRNMDSSYNAFSSSFAFTVESSTPSPSKQSPSASWSNTSGGTEVTVVAGDSNTVTCTFNSTPSSGWSINDPVITGITVNTTTGDVSIDPTNMMSGTYYVDATYPEDNSYYEGYGQLLIRVLPSGSNPNFYYSPDSMTIYNDGTSSSGNLVNNLSDPQNIQISYSSSDSSIASVDNSGLVTWVSGGSATITAEALLISPQKPRLVATATLYVTCEVQKTTPSGIWSNLSSLGKCIVVAGDTNTVTCTFSGTPESGWSFNDPMITGITVDATNYTVTIDPTNMMSGTYHVYAEYPEDSSYYYNNMELSIRVLPPGSDVNFFFGDDSYSLDDSMNQSMDINIETTISNTISWSSSDTGVCLIGSSIMSWNVATITYVSDGSATLTATIDDNGTTHTATCTVTCSSMTP